MDKITKFMDSYFLPIWLSISAWFIISEVNALVSDATEYYKLVTTIVTSVMMTFWIIVLFRFRKNHALQKKDNVDRK